MGPASPLYRPRDDDAIVQTALADIAAGRLVGVDAVALRFGGWHCARVDGLRPSGTMPTAGFAVNRAVDGPSAGERGDIVVASLVWTIAAIQAGDRLRRLVAAIDAAGERRFAASVVGTLVRLVVDGCPGDAPLRTVRVFPALSLRLYVDHPRIVVIGWQADAIGA